MAPQLNISVDKVHPRHFFPGTREIRLDGVSFTGMVRPHYIDPSLHKGPLDGNWTLWLTEGSLCKALCLAGFDIKHMITQPDQSTPESVHHWASLLRCGYANTKVWIVADPCEPQMAEAIPAEADMRSADGVPYDDIVNSEIQKFGRLKPRIIRKLKSVVERFDG